MREIQKIAAVILFVLACFTVYGLWETRQPIALGVSGGKGKPSDDSTNVASLVDQSTLKMAQQVARLATTAEEHPLAAEALRLADYDVDLTFADAIRVARLHPPPLSKEAKELKARVEKAEKVLEAEQERAKQLAEDMGKAPANKQDAITADLIQAEADLELAQDELGDAKHDLEQAGGDPVERINAMKQEHEETTHATAGTLPTIVEPEQPGGLYHRAVQWKELHNKQMQLWQAKSAVAQGEAALQEKHNELDAQLEREKANDPELAHHAKKTKDAATMSHVTADAKSSTETQALLKKTEKLSEDQKLLEAYDKRIETKKDLAAVYGKWIDVVAGRQTAVVHRGLLGIAVILAIGIISVFFTSWMDSLVLRVPMDRRQVESLRTVARVSSQIVALCLILLVVFGPPNQLGTFLGLAGAGLTVALKDFIVSFVGWFVLMGKNGIRLADWVEINGVTGEVVQIGPFHTVLLETGNWTDSGHPTGRRVTFTNSYAIEGHYFNFSTTGQWLWDELQVVLPAGQDPYPMVEAIHKKVSEATQQSMQEAEKEWRGATTSREMSNFSAKPAVSVKPVVGGIELGVRYITRANERYLMRTKLYQAAIEVLGGKGIPPSAAPPSGAPPSTPPPTPPPEKVPSGTP